MMAVRALARRRAPLPPHAPLAAAAVVPRAWYHAADHHVPAPPPPRALARALDALLATSTDVAAADFVDCFLDGDLGARGEAAARLGGLPPGEQHRLLSRVAACSPHALECLHGLRAACALGGAGAGAPPWPRALDHSVVHTMRPLYGPSFTRVAQLSVAPGAPAHVHDLLLAAQHSERVHATAHAADFLRKFGARRMVHGMFHAADPSDLLAVLYSAVLPSMPAGMAQIDAQSGGPPGAAGQWDIHSGLGLAGHAEDDSGHAADGAWLRVFSPRHAQDEDAARLPANTVAFYSVGSPHAAMRGMKLGTRIIYSVASAICEAAPGVQTVCTMSPIPGFTGFLRAQAEAGGLHLAPDEEAAVALAAAALRDWRGAGGIVAGAAAAPSAAADGAVAPARTLVALLQRPAWFDCEPAREALKPVLIRLCREYLTQPEVGPRGAKGPRCKVSQFHLGNGARMHRLCWAADTSPAGLLRSGSLMVNYLYSSTGKPGLQHTMRVRAETFAADNCAPLAEPVLVVA